MRKGTLKRGAQKIFDELAKIGIRDKEDVEGLTELNQMQGLEEKCG